MMISFPPRFVGLFLSFVALGLGCSAPASRPPGGEGGEGGGVGGEGGGTAGSGGSGGQGGLEGGGLDAGPDANPAAEAGPSCARAEIQASRPPIDVIVLIDTSGSMKEEAANVQMNINKIGDFLTSAGLDFRVVLISDDTVCVPPPLGGAACASNPPLYRKVPQRVGSKDALDLILRTFDATAAPLIWSDFVRPDALKAFVPVTDDDAGIFFFPGDPVKFDTDLLMRGGDTFGTASMRKYIFYPICGASDADPMMTCGPGMVNNGATYLKLATMTGGKHFPLCAPDFGPAFTSIGQGVAAVVACEIVVPPPPAGETLDPDKVNVVHTPSSGMPAKVPFDNTMACDAGANGWQWSTDMKKIFLCGDICDRLKADATSKLAVELGCATCTGTACR